MALQRNTKYPGRFDNATSTQTQGAFKNRTTDVSKDGSYLEKDWLNDWSALFSSILDETGISPNGNVDEVGNSQYFTELKKMLGRNRTWTNEGVSRSLSTEYTNNTMFPICVSVTCIATGSGNWDSTLLIDGVDMAQSGGTQFMPNQIYAEVQPGSTYEVQATSASILRWFELA